jgi:hypothetical protein
MSSMHLRILHSDGAQLLVLSTTTQKNFCKTFAKMDLNPPLNDAKEKPTSAARAEIENKKLVDIKVEKGV